MANRLLTPLCSLATILLLAGCERSSTEQPSLAASATPAAAASSAAPAPPPKPWYQGSWEGSYQAKLHVVTGEPKAWLVPQWKVDKGDGASGAGKLRLSIDEQGTVDGTSNGPLGALSVTGRVDDDHISAQLTPAEPDTPAESFQGYLLADHKDNALAATISVSTGNSLTVRTATATLKKQAQ